jgi:2-hydroxychromene-2-carboxylate isomerase
MIDFYFDFVSPFGYFASLRIEALAERHGLGVRWHPILIGVTVMKLMGMQPILEIPLKGTYMKRELQRYCAMFDVTMRRDASQAPQSALAASRALALLLARQDAAAVTFAKACYHAYWQDCLDLNRQDVVLALAQSAGVSTSGLELLGTDASKDALRLAMDQAVAAGVFGSPFFIIEEEPFFGVDKLELIELWLSRRTGQTSPADAGRK